MRAKLIGVAALTILTGVAVWSLQVPIQAQNAPAAAVLFTGEAPAPDGAMTLWYRQPAADHPYTPPVGGRGGGPGAAEWVRALPVGNGRLGAMVFGGVVNERLQLNEDTLWAGGPYDPVNPDSLAALPEVRSLLFDAKYSEAAKLITDKVMAKPLAQMPYETIGNLLLTFSATSSVENYRRELDLDNAIARVQYSSGGVRYEREVFSSTVDQVIVVRLTAGQPGKISFKTVRDTS